MNLASESSAESSEQREKPFTLSRLLLDAVWWSLVLATLCASIAGNYGAINWKADTFSQFRTHYMVAAGILFTVGMLRKRYALAGLCVFIGLLNAIEVLRLPDFQKQPPELPLYRAFSVNLQRSNPHPERAFRRIHEIRPDFVALIEMRQIWLERLEAFRRDYPYRTPLRRGTMVLSKFPLREIRPTVGGIGSVTVAATLPGSRTPLTIVAIHPPSPSSKQAWDWRNNAFEALAEFSRAQNSPLLAMGDFNSTEFSPHFRKILQSGDLKLVRESFIPDPTWPASFGPLGIKIDHFLYRRISPVNARVGPDIGSDHRPIILEFTVTPTAKAP